MKTTLSFLAAALLCALGSSAFAADATWSNTAGGTWNTTGNWSGGVVASGTDAVADFSTLDITADATVTLGAPVTIGSLLFGDATTPSNNWIVSGSAITLAVTTGAPTIQVNNQTVTFNAALLGTQGFNKTGAGTLMLSAANTYTGSTTVSGGVLMAGIANAFGSSAPLVLNSGTVNINGFDQTVGALGGSAGTLITTSTAAGTKTLTASFASGTSTFDGMIADNGSGLVAFTKTGAGTQILSGNNTYTGATNIKAGTLVLSGSYSTSAGNNFIVGGAGTYSALSATGGLSVTNSGSSANIYVGNANNDRSVLSISNNATYNLLRVGWVAGSSGALNITGGAVNVAGGVGNGIYLGNNGATSYGYARISGGSVTANELDVSAGGNGVMDLLGGTVTVANYMLLTQASTGNDMLNITSGTLKATGATNQSARSNGGNAGTNILNLGAGGLYDMGSKVYGLNVATTNSPTTILTLNGGTLITGGITTGGATSIVNFNGGTLKAGGASATYLQGLTGAYVHSGGGTIDNNGNAITIGQNLLAASGTGISSISFSNGGSGYIGAPFVQISGGGGSGATAVAQIDSNGVLTGITVTSPGTGYTSTPTITLLGGGAAVAASGATATMGANSSGGMTFNGSATTTLTGSSTYTGTTTVNAGTVLISSTANNLTGPINVNGGILAGGLAANTFAGITGNITVAAGGGFGFNNIGIFNQSTYANNLFLSGTGSSASFGALELGGNVTASGTITLNADARITHNWNIGTINGPIVGSNKSLTLATFQASQYGIYANGNISLGSGALIVNGIGTVSNEDVSLSGSNSYSGGTQVNSGALYISNTNAMPGWNTGAFRVGSGGTLSVANAFSDSNVATMLSTGTFAAGANFGFNTGAGDRSYSTNIADTTGGSLGIGKFGNNTLTLSGTNTYTGSTAVNAGTLKLGGSNAMLASAGTLTVASGATLDLNGFNATGGALAGSGTVGNNSGSGTSTLLVYGTYAPATQTVVIKDNLGTAGGKVALTKAGPSTMTLSGTANTYSGATAVNGKIVLAGEALGNGTIYAPGNYSPLNYGTLQLTGTLANTSGLALANGGIFIDGDSTAANNNGVTNRINSAATLTMGGGTFTLASPAASNTHSQSLASLSTGPGYNLINANATTGTANLTFTGAAASVYSRSTGAMVNFAQGTGFNVAFTNAPTTNVSGSGADAILTGAFLSGGDFVKAAAGTLSAPTYVTTLTADKNVNVTGALSTSGSISINSLRFNDATQRIVTVGASDTLTIASGGIIAGSSAPKALATGISGILGGSITSGTNELFISVQNATDQRNNFGMIIGSQIVDNGSTPLNLNVTGNGSVLLSNTANSFTGNIYMNGGIIAMSGYGATRTNVTDGVLGGTNTIYASSGANYVLADLGTTNDWSAKHSISISPGAFFDISTQSGPITVKASVTGSGVFGIGNSTYNSGNGVIIPVSESGFTGTYMIGTNLRADEGVGLSSNANLFLAQLNTGGAGVLETSGNMVRSIGFGPGQVRIGQGFNGNAFGGGFSAVSGTAGANPITVSLGGLATPQTLTWGVGGFMPAASGGIASGLVLQNANANNTLTWVNPINNNGYSVAVWQNASTTGTSTQATMTGVISGTGGFFKNGSGLLVLSATNTYTGKTSITKGAISVASIGSVSGTGNLGAPSNSTNGTIDIGYSTNSATLVYTGTGETTDRVVNFAGSTGGATLDQSGSGLLKFTSAFTSASGGNKNLTLQGSTSGTGEIANTIGDGSGNSNTLTKTGTGLWKLSGTNTYTGNTSISGGILSVSTIANSGSACSIGASTNAATGLHIGGGTLQYTGVSGSTDRAFYIDASSTGAVEITNPSTAFTFGGGSSATVSSNFTKLGAGTLILTGTNVYTGATAINGGTLQIGNGGNTGSIAGTGVSVAQGATLAFNRTDNYGGNFGNTISGAGGVNILSGTLTLTAANTYSGATKVNAGTLTLNNNLALQNSPLDTTGAGNVTLGSGVTAPTLGGLSGSSDLSTVITGNYNLVTALTLNPVAGQSLTYSGNITNGAAAMALTKTGSGTQILSGNNTYTGATNVQAGTLVLSGSYSTNAGNNFIVGGAGTYSALAATGGLSVTNSGSNASIYVGNANNDRSVLSISNNTIYNYLRVGAAAGSSGALSLTSGSLNVAGSYAGNGILLAGGGTTSYGYARISGGSVTANELDVSASGNGVMDLLGGTVTVANFMLFNQQATGNDMLNITGGTLKAIGAANQTARASGGNAGTNILNLGVGGLYDMGSTVFSLNVAITNSPTTLLTLNGGTLITGRISSGGATSIMNFNGGTLKAGAASATYLQGLSGAYVHSGGGTIDNNGNAITIGQNLLAASGTGIASITLTGSGSGYIGAPFVQITGGGGSGATAVAQIDPVTGVITAITVTSPGTGYTSTPTVTLLGGGAATPASGITVSTAAVSSGGMGFSGSGTTTLTGNSTYTGATSVSAGKLIVSGSLAGTTSLSVSTGAELNVNGLVNTASSMTLAGTLSGSGTVGAVTVQSGGVLAPGNSPGVLTTGSLALNAGGSYKLELNATTGTAGTNWDKVAASTLDLSALSSSNKFTLTLQTLTSGNANGSLAGFNPANNYTWGGVITFGTLAGSFSSDLFTVNTAGFVNTFDGSFSVVQNGSQLDLQYLAIPEPSVVASLVSGLGMLVFLQRRRRK